MKLQNTFFLLLAVPVLTVAAPLTGSGTHLPVPGATGATAPGIAPTLVIGSSVFTGTWDSTVAPAWQGTFNATGLYPGGTNGVSTSNWDFTTLTAGLPSGTFFRFGDVDSGSGNSEVFTLTAYDSANNPITAAWLDQPTHVAGANPLEFVLAAMPGWSFSGGVYTIDGNSVIAFNPAITVSLPSNQAIYKLAINKSDTSFGFGLAAPSAVPEPGAWMLLGTGLVTLGVFRRRQTAKLR